MNLFSYFRASGPSASKVSPEMVQTRYIALRRRTFWAATIAYSLYYVCRMSLSVVKQPIIDAGAMTPGQLGLIGSSLLFVYSVGKFTNGFIADYCNIRKFMAAGLLVSSLINLIMGAAGLLHGAGAIGPGMLFAIFTVVWGVNGWVQSMGAPPGLISLSRWFPLSKRGTYYSIFSSSPHIGEFLAFIFIGASVGVLGWQYGFILSAAGGLVGTALIWIFVSDTPESEGLPSIQELSGEQPRPTDSMPVKKLQKMVFAHPGIWIIAASSAFVYIARYAVAGWGVLFLQKAKGFSLESAAQIIAFSAAFGVLGTVAAGWLSDKVFRGRRMEPAIISGMLSFVFLALFLFAGGGYLINTLYVSLFSLFIGILYCIVAGLMALDIVPRKATGAALGIVGISSYVAAGIQDIASGYLIEGFAVSPASYPGEAEKLAMTVYDFTPVSIFWLAAALAAFILPALFWKKMRTFAD